MREVARRWVLPAWLGFAVACSSRDDIGPANDSGAAEHADAPLESGAPTCPSAPVLDPISARRAACAFGAGAMPLETLGITADFRNAIPIRHVVVLMKENRSFDEYFGQLWRRGQPASEPLPGTFSNPDPTGVAVFPFHETTTCVAANPDHTWDGLHAAVNGGKMDGFVRQSGAAAMGYYDESDLPFYYFLANTFALADRHFSSVLGPTFPNRYYFLLGTSVGITCTGCAMPPLDTPNILDALTQKGVDWAAYSEDGDPFEGVLGLDWQNAHASHLHPIAELEPALAAGSVAPVVFVDARQELRDEHPMADVQVGEAWTREIYDAVVASAIWPTTAIVWVYDEGGGFADHVPPPTSCVPAPLEAAFFELGPRVPMVVASPWARRHYVSHLVHEHTSITRFIETVFDLPALTARDANSDALLDMFDFSCAPAAVPAAPAAGTGGCVP
jgi:phospholipase C